VINLNNPALLTGLVQNEIFQSVTLVMTRLRAGLRCALARERAPA
jgi:hypothetical protein